MLASALAMSLAGCVLRSAPKTTAATPAPPKPAVAPAPAPPPQPLSIHQTDVELTSPQPISEEARATTEPPQEPAPTPVPPKPARSRASQTPRNDTAPAPVGPTPPETTERPPVQPLVTPEEQRQYQASAQRDSQEAKAILDHPPTHSLNHKQQQAKRSAERFLQLAADAEKRLDYRQASELAARALVFAKELQP
jgi:hypothetical protein